MNLSDLTMKTRRSSKSDLSRLCQAIRSVTLFRAFCGVILSLCYKLYPFLPVNLISFLFAAGHKVY